MPCCLLSRRSSAGVRSDALSPAGAGRSVRAPHPRSAWRAYALRRTGLSSASACASGVGGGTMVVRAGGAGSQWWDFRPRHQHPQSWRGGAVFGQ